MIPHANGAKFKEEEEEEIPYPYEKAKEVNWYDKLLLNRPLKVISIVILLTIVAPILLYRFIFFTSEDWPPSDNHSLGSCVLPRISRLPCGLGQLPQTDCHPQCCYDIKNSFCYHRFPSRFSFILDRQWTEEAMLRPRISTVPYASQSSILSLRLSVDEISSTHLSLTFYDPRETNLEGRRIESKTYDYEVSSPESNVLVWGPQGPIFNTARGPLIASENIWEIAFKLTNDTIYGLGELPLKPGTVKVIYNHDGGLSTLPLIYAKVNGSYHGLLMDIETPTEVTIQGDNSIIIRSITNFGLKLHLFVGPEPKDVMRDVMTLLGDKKQLEYWMLGAHICSETTNDEVDPLDGLRKFIADAALDKLPFESHCGSKPIVFNAYEDVKEIISIETGAEILKAAGKKFIPHVSPYIRFDFFEEITETTTAERASDTSTTLDSSNNDITTPRMSTNLVLDYQEFMLQWNTADNVTTVYNGSISSLDKQIAYPDYEVVNDEFLKKLWPYDVEIHGIILENNWPLDESMKNFNETYEQLPYFTENLQSAFNSTPQWNIFRPRGGRYIYEHNKYSNNFVNAFHKIANDIPLWATSQWMKTDVVINRQNVDASWTNLQNELVQAALGGISGHWLWSTPVCGDTSNFDIDTQTNLCVKWYMAATYFPMIKIHSNTIERHPLAFRGTHKALVVNSLNKRLSFLPYFHTVLQEGPLLRPMFYQFPLADELSNLTSQFSVGDDLLIAPNLLPTQSHVHVHVPPGTWYEYLSGLKIDAEQGEVITMTTSEADFLTFVRGGSIIVVQNNVTDSADETRRVSQYNLVIATKTKSDEDKTETHRAQGKLFVSQNMTIHFKLNETNLIITAEGNDFELICGAKPILANIIKQIKIYGLENEENNYDHHKQIATSITLCELETKDEIVFAVDR